MIGWDDMRLFLALARCGNLREAGSIAGVSAATISRRAVNLERALGVSLLIREKNGMHLTEQGEKVMQQAIEMEGAMLQLSRLMKADLPVVRVAAGAWMSRFLAGFQSTLCTPDDDFIIEWVTATERSDIARRDAEVGIRNHRPQEAGLAGRRLALVRFAVYTALGKATSDSDSADWVTTSKAYTPSARWTHQQAGRIVARVSEPTLMLPLALAGTGQVVLPCLVGDAEARLRRVGQPIVELEHEQWLVAHHDDRNLPAVRTVIDRLVLLIQGASVRLAGEGIDV